ncbi:MAG TPA: ABC transporter substrate-binding protein [Usitatibacter sp.]|nr:ABC transporter substrate-binding protein [Usitatibacter sp.]
MRRSLASRRTFLKGSAAAAAVGAFPHIARAADPVRVGLILPLTGPFASTGRQIEAAVRLYMARNGDTAAGRKVELLVRDDTGLAPETTKRLAQELVARDNVMFLAGFGLTPLAFATAPVATESKTPMVVMGAATSVVPQRSPFIVRAGFTVPQITAPIAQWANRNGIKRVVSSVTDFAPGLECEKTFIKFFTEGGGTIIESIRTPLQNPDYGPFLQRAKDQKPDAMFIFVPSGQGAAIMKQFSERGLKEAGIKLIGTGDILDDDLLEAIGPSALGAITSHHYSAAHDSPENRAYVDAFMKANNGMRPNFMSVNGYDGMHAIYEMLRKTGGTGTGEQLVNAAKGLAWVSPRGPISIDPATRDVVQNIYIRRCEMVNGKLWNVEFDKIENVKDPG